MNSCVTVSAAPNGATSYRDPKEKSHYLAVLETTALKLTKRPRAFV
jgi:hypothetical protein